LYAPVCIPNHGIFVIYYKKRYQTVVFYKKDRLFVIHRVERYCHRGIDLRDLSLFMNMHKIKLYISSRKHLKKIS